MSLVWKSAPSIRSKLRSFSELHVRSTPSLSSAAENALIRNSLTGNLGSHVTGPAMADFSHTMYSCLFRGSLVRECVGVRNLTMSSSFSRSFASRASKGTEKSQDKAKKDVTTVEDPFDAPTYHIPEKPVTFTEGASYSLVILAGLGVAGAAGYAVFKELIFQPKEYKIFDKALKRIQDDSQVRVRLGSPIKGYGQESRNRAARQRIPNRIHTDEDGVEHVEINFYIRGPQGAGKVFTEMFKDKTDNEWKYTYLIVEITSPSPARLMLESYLPA